MPVKMSVVFNGAALLVGVISLGYALKSEFSSNDEPPCSERYPRSIRFSLDRDGEPMAIDELQSQLGNLDWGLGNGTKVVKLNSGPAKHALQLDLKPAPVKTDAQEERPGIGFSWSPTSMGKPLTACLAYSVYVPKEFAFGRGGHLPGFEGLLKAVDAESGADKEPQFGFSTLFAVSAHGAAHVALQVGLDGKNSTESTEQSFDIPSGQWVRLEQELALNQPQDKDGSIRAWVNGQLVVDQHNLIFRKDPAVGISGVAAQASVGERVGEAAKGTTKLWLTPFEVYLH